MPCQNIQVILEMATLRVLNFLLRFWYFFPTFMHNPTSHNKGFRTAEKERDKTEKDQGREAKLAKSVPSCE